MMNNATVPVATIVSFARENGFIVNPADIERSRAAALKTRTRFGLAYEFPKVLTDQCDGAVGAAARGIGDGVLPNLLPEAGSLVDTLGGTSNRENIWNSDRRVADIIANNWRQNEAITGFDALAHPYARLGGELAGGLLAPFGAKATTVPQLAKVGAAYGAAAGFGAGDDLSSRRAQAAAGSGIGAVGGAAIGADGAEAEPQMASG